MTDKTTSYRKQYLWDNPVKATAMEALGNQNSQNGPNLGIVGAPAYRLVQLDARSERRQMIVDLGLDGVNVARAKASHEASILRAYYLKWSANASYVMTLDDDADYFFTAPMNGCAVFVAGNEDTPTVCHANFSLDEDVRDRYALRDRLYDALRPHAVGANQPQSLLPSFYLQPGGVTSSFTSVYGFRDSHQGQSRWSFYYHIVLMANQPWANTNKDEVKVRGSEKPYFITGQLWPNKRLPVWRGWFGHYVLEKTGW
jgi:hypothetical protein